MDDKTRVWKAALMAARGLDICYPSPNISWEKQSLSMLNYWDEMLVDYTMLIRMEPELILFCNEVLIDYVDDRLQ